MIRAQRVPPAELSGVTLSFDLRAGERSTLSADIGLSVAVLLHHSGSRAGGYVTVSGAPQGFDEVVTDRVGTLLKKLSAMGITSDGLECAVIGGTSRSSWQVERLRRVLRDMKLDAKTLDVLGEDVRRKIAFNLDTGMVRFSGKQEDPSRWNPSKGTLNINDGKSVFASDSVTGVVANATRFFREKNTFKGLRELVFPEYLHRGGTMTFTLWSAACSSGQEAYSYAMYLSRLRERSNAPFPVKVLGTDINESLVEEAKKGAYVVSDGDIRDFSAYFNRYGKLEGDRFTVGRDVQAMTHFRPYDISKPVQQTRFHVIICANVFQYYAPPARRHFLELFVQACHRPGYIFVGPPDREAVRELELEYFPKYGLLRVPDYTP